MRPLRKALLAGAGAIALAGVAGLTAAEIKNAHQLDVRLPDGSLAHIRYVGDTPPTVTFAPAPMAFSILSPASDPFRAEAPFAALERMSEVMDRQVDALFQEEEAQSVLGLAAPDLSQVVVRTLPPDAQSFSMISTMSGKGVCTRSVQYRSLGDGKPPQIVTHTSGACTVDDGRPALSATSGSAPAASQPELAGRQRV